MEGRIKREEEKKERRKEGLPHISKDKVALLSQIKIV